MLKHLREEYGITGGDLGVVALALMFTAALVFLFVGPSPLEGLFVHHDEPAATAATPGEVSVGILPEKKP